MRLSFEPTSELLGEAAEDSAIEAAVEAAGVGGGTVAPPAVSDADDTPLVVITLGAEANDFPFAVDGLTKPEAVRRLIWSALATIASTFTS